MRKTLLLTLILSLNMVAEDGNLDPVYLLKISNYPKFTTEMILKSGKRVEFSSVKSMMNFYFHQRSIQIWGRE